MTDIHASRLVNRLTESHVADFKTEIAAWSNHVKLDGAVNLYIAKACACVVACAGTALREEFFSYFPVGMMLDEVAVADFSWSIEKRAEIVNSPNDLRDMFDRISEKLSMIYAPDGVSARVGESLDADIQLQIAFEKGSEPSEEPWDSGKPGFS